MGCVAARWYLGDPLVPPSLMIIGNWQVPPAFSDRGQQLGQIVTSHSKPAPYSGGAVVSPTVNE